MKKEITMTVLFLANSLPSFAASGLVDTSQTYSSGLLVWLFLGFCAMIVTVQLVPSLVLFFGMIKGLFARVPETKVEGIVAGE